MLPLVLESSGVQRTVDLPVKEYPLYLPTLPAALRLHQ